MSDPFTDANDFSKEENEENQEQPKIELDLLDKVEDQTPLKAKEKRRSKKENLKKQEKKKEQKEKVKKTEDSKIHLIDSNKGKITFTSKQKTIAAILYVAIVVTCLITIVGAVWATFDLFMQTGKLSLFLTLSFGYQIAIIGGFSAGFFFLLIFFIGLARKGVKNITTVLFKHRDVEEKYKNKTIVKIFAGAIMFSIFAILIGILLAIIIELIMGSSTTFSLTAIFSFFESTGPFILSLGLFLLGMVGLAFSLNFIYYNGYYFLLRIVTDLEKDE